MATGYENDYGILQSGYWKVEVDTLAPHWVSLKADPDGFGLYGEEMLEPGLGGQTVMETRDEILRSRSARGAQGALIDGLTLQVTGIPIGDVALVDWRIILAGDMGQTLRVEVTRQILRPVELVTDLPFGLHLVRLFALWSRPDLHINHDPDGPFTPGYSTYEERRVRRVIGYHDAGEMERFIAHGAPMYPDLALKIDAGSYHVEQHYTQHVLLGVSSRNFAGGAQTLEPGTERYTIDFEIIPQGTLAPVDFRSSNPRVDRFVRGFFDGHVLSAVAADHEFFGNNPYRHAFAPCAMVFEMKGFMISDRPGWSEAQGDMEARWRKQIRRVLAHGRRSRDRVLTMFDSGIWQDACGEITAEYGSPAQQGTFVIGCLYHLLKTGDRAFALEIADELEVLLGGLCKLRSEEYDGLLVSDLPGTPGSPASGYNDCLSVGHRDTYTNIIAYDAFNKFSSLCMFLGRDEQARQYRAWADEITAAVNRHQWNETGNRFVGWIDVTGKLHDAWFADINFLAVSTGLSTPEHAASLLESFLAHPNHHLMFCAGLNLEPITDGSLTAPMEFGDNINGTVYLGPMSEELFVRGAIGGAESAWVMLSEVMQQWEKDRFAGGGQFVDWVRPCYHLFSPQQNTTGKASWTWRTDWKGGESPTGAASEPYLSDNGAVLWALYAGVLGIQPDFQGLTLAPHLPAALAGLEAGIRLLGRKLQLRYHGTGDRLQELRVNNQIITGKRLAWEQLPDNSILDLYLA